MSEYNQTLYDRLKNDLVRLDEFLVDKGFNRVNKHAGPLPFEHENLETYLDDYYQRPIFEAIDYCGRQWSKVDTSVRFPTILRYTREDEDPRTISVDITLWYPETLSHDFHNITLRDSRTTADTRTENLFEYRNKPNPLEALVNAMV